MSDAADQPTTTIQEHAAAAVGDIRNALAELTAALGAPERAVSEEILRPAHCLARGVVGVAEVVVDQLAQFVERQRELADQMAAWAELQHQLADHMAAWAELQRQLAGAFAVWLAPAGGAAKVTQRLLHELDGRERPEAPVPPQRGRKR
jgi:hypothetical protein